MLRADALQKGRHCFERIEARFEIDEKRKPVSVFKEAKESNKSAEEFYGWPIERQHTRQTTNVATSENSVYRIFNDLPTSIPINFSTSHVYSHKLKQQERIPKHSAINQLPDEAEGKKNKTSSKHNIRLYGKSHIHSTDTCTLRTRIGLLYAFHYRSLGVISITMVSATNAI